MSRQLRLPSRPGTVHHKTACWRYQWRILRRISQAHEALPFEELTPAIEEYDYWFTGPV